MVQLQLGGRSLLCYDFEGLCRFDPSVILLLYDHDQMLSFSVAFLILSIAISNGVRPLLGNPNYFSNDQVMNWIFLLSINHLEHVQHCLDLHFKLG